MFQPPLSRDVERAVFVNPTLPLEAGAVRSPDVGAGNLFGQALRTCVLHQPIEASLSPAVRLARTAGAERRRQEQHRETDAHVRTVWPAGRVACSSGDIPEHWPTELPRTISARVPAMTHGQCVRSVCAKSLAPRKFVLHRIAVIIRVCRSQLDCRDET